MDGAAAGELIQVLDERGEATGRALPVEEAHASGAWHGAVVVWVLRPDGGVLLRREAREDPCAPLRLGPTVHVHAGFGPPAAEAAAAVERRLGLSLPRGGLQRLGTFRSERCCEAAGRRYLDREHQEVFATWDDTPLEELVLDPTAVDAVYEVPLPRAVALFESGASVPAPGFDSMQRVSNALLYEADVPAEGRAAVLEQLRALSAWVGQGPEPGSP